MILSGQRKGQEEANSRSRIPDIWPALDTTEVPYPCEC